MIKKVFEIGFISDEIDITLWVGTRKNGLSIRKVKYLEEEGWYIKEIHGQINPADLDFIIE